MKSGFLNNYLAESQRVETPATSGEDQGHEMPVHGEIHTIAGGFLRWRVHCFSAQEVCTFGDASRGVGSRRRARR